MGQQRAPRATQNGTPVLEAPERRSETQCPACLSRRTRQSELGVQLRECTRCDCLFGTLYLGESYVLVKPFMKAAPEGCRERPFDFTTLGSRGIGRRHGFYDPEDGYVTQAG